MTHSSPQAVIERLAEIEQDLAGRQNEYEKAAGDRARLVRDWEKALAIARKTAKGNDAETRKAVALIAASEYEDDDGNLYTRLRDAEDLYEASKVVIRVLETRSAIGMSILKAHGRG